MGLRWEFSWPKLWERKGHRCAGLPRTLICPVWVFSPSQLSAVQLWNPFIKEACGCVCLLVNAYYILAGAGWLTETAARNQPCITESAHPKAWAHLCPGEAGLGPTTPGKVGPPGTGAGAHSSQAGKGKEVEPRAGKVCDIRVTAEFILQQALACSSFLILLAIVAKRRCYAMVGRVTLATANCSARNRL